jgi:hypothetical protein
MPDISPEQRRELERDTLLTNVPRCPIAMRRVRGPRLGSR